MVRLLAGLSGFAAAQPLPAGPSAYAEVSSSGRDTLRVRAAAYAAHNPDAAAVMGAVIPGYLSDRGLPPVRGHFIFTESGLVFEGAGRVSEASSVSLAYLDDQDGRPVYVFRVDAGVFETDAPGPLLEVADHPEWLSGLAAPAPAERPLVDATDSAAIWRAARAMTASEYADSLYALFGRPQAPVGLIGRRGRSAGRLGEYIAGRDSLALDPARMTGPIQLRHALAHELGHRWQARARAQVETLWAGTGPIRDPKRYGFGDTSEHQAEAIAFAVSFLQTTASADTPSAQALDLLDHYELMVPGTRTMARYLALQPLYRHHPLRSLLTTGQPS
jgi:hypothetical protein